MSSESNPYAKFGPNRKKFSVPEELPGIKATPEKILQALDKIISNSEQKTSLFGSPLRPPPDFETSSLSQHETDALSIFTKTANACALECAAINTLLPALEKMVDKMDEDTRMLVTLFKIQHSLVRGVWGDQMQEFDNKVRNVLQKKVDAAKAAQP